MNKTALMNAWAGFWEGRTAREKMLLTWGGAVLGVVLVYSVLWAPAQQGRVQLRETLPAMRHQIAQMTAQADEARSLAAAAQGVPPTGAALKDALAGSLTQNGLAGAQVQLAGDAVSIDLKNVAFPTWTMWLDDARRQFKVHVTQAHMTALKADGQVDVSATLQSAGARGGQ